MTKSALSFLMALLVALTACEGGAGDPDGGTTAGPRPPQNHAWVIFGSDTVLAEVADDEEERQQGLMGRQSLEPGRGMLFVFDDQRTRSFWMRNTYVPLDIAFLDRSQVIVDIQQMEPLTEEYYQSARPAMFGLEVPQGWFAEQGIEVGAVAEIVYGRR